MTGLLLVQLLASRKITDMRIEASEDGRIFQLREALYLSYRLLFPAMSQRSLSKENEGNFTFVSVQSTLPHKQAE